MDQEFFLIQVLACPFGYGCFELTKLFKELIGLHRIGETIIDIPLSKKGAHLVRI